MKSGRKDLALVVLSSGSPERALFVALEPGAHRIVVMDDAGRSDGVEYRVEGSAPDAPL